MKKTLPIIRVESIDNIDYKKPFIISADKLFDWNIIKKWNLSRLKKQFGNMDVIVYRSNKEMKWRNDSKQMSLSSYIDYIRTTKDKEPYYLVDWSISLTPSFVSNIKNKVKYPKEFSSWNNIKWFKDKLFFSFYIGPTNSYSDWHIDILSSSAWAICIQGEKRWKFKTLFTEYHGVQKKGDLVYTPGGMIHKVTNIKPSVILTDNFVNKHNILGVVISFIPNVLKILYRTWKRRNSKKNNDNYFQ